jgi:hypothetical protein
VRITSRTTYWGKECLECETREMWNMKTTLFLAFKVASYSYLVFPSSLEVTSQMYAYVRPNVRKGAINRFYPWMVRTNSIDLSRGNHIILWIIFFQYPFSSPAHSVRFIKVTDRQHPRLGPLDATSCRYADMVQSAIREPARAASSPVYVPQIYGFIDLQQRKTFIVRYSI